MKVGRSGGEKVACHLLHSQVFTFFSWNSLVCYCTETLFTFLIISRCSVLNSKFIVVCGLGATSDCFFMMLVYFLFFSLFLLFLEVETMPSCYLYLICSPSFYTGV